MAVLAIALGLIVGTLNHDLVNVDLMWTEITWPSGLLILTAMVIGILFGLILSWLFSVLPLKLKLRRLAARSDDQRPVAGINDD